MSVLEALIVGFVQGITEFLPISSSAHIVLTTYLLNIQFPGLILEIFLHLASVLAVIIFYRKDLYRIVAGFLAYIRYRSPLDYAAFKFGLYLIVATGISGGLGVLLTDWIDDSLKAPPVIALALFVTGFFLIFIERFHRLGNKTEENMSWIDTCVVALAQTLAVLPGISRSGSTLIAGLWMGLNRETAVRFSFLLSIPIILGSTVLLVKDLEPGLVNQTGALPIVTAFVASFLFSIIGIKWLINFLNKGRLTYFAIYCFILATIVFLFFDSNMQMAIN